MLWGGLGTGDAVTRGSSFKSDDAVEVGGSVNRAGVTDSGPSVRIDSYHPDETSQVRQRDSAPRFAARPVFVPLSDARGACDFGLRRRVDSRTSLLWLDGDYSDRYVRMSTSNQATWTASLSRLGTTSGNDTMR